MRTRDIIEENCIRIMSALKENTVFTREDLIFLIKFLREMADSFERKLNS